jgi:ATP-dependent Clp protease ATP-binding subunit ClpC
VEQEFGSDALSRTCRGRLAFTPGAKRALELALREALELGCRHIGSEHVLLGLIRGDGPARTILCRLGVDPSELQTRVRGTLAGMSRVVRR